MRGHVLWIARRCCEVRRPPCSALTLEHAVFCLQISTGRILRLQDRQDISRTIAPENFGFGSSHRNGTEAPSRSLQARLRSPSKVLPRVVISSTDTYA